MPAPTVAQVRGHVASVVKKVRDARVIGIRADDWNGPDQIAIDGTSFRVVICRSPLEVREELIDLTEGGLDGRFRQPGLAFERLEDVLEAGA